MKGQKQEAEEEAVPADGLGAEAEAYGVGEEGSTSSPQTHQNLSVEEDDGAVYRGFVVWLVPSHAPVGRILLHVMDGPCCSHNDGGSLGTKGFRYLLALQE